MNIWRPFTQMQSINHFPTVEKAKGAYVYLSNGKKIFDAISSWWVITHGHCDEDIMEAIQKESRKRDQIIFSNFSHEPALELADLLSEFVPSSLGHVFFSDNGSTAVEVAIKMAIQAQGQRGLPLKKKILFFEKAYHGDTSGAMSVGGSSLFTNPYRPLLVDFIKTKQGRYSFHSLDDYLIDFYSKIHSHAHEIAAVIIEPIIQGAGGMVIWPIEAMIKIKKMCEENNIFLIFDEVMTGFGRTGKMFAFEHAEVVPDLLCLSKGLTGGALPMSLTLATSEIYQAFLSKDVTKMFFHGHSFTANPIACAAAVANIKKFKKEKIVDKILSIESTHRECLDRISLPFIKDKRSKGVVGVLELEEGISSYGSHCSNRITSSILEKGIFLRPLGNVIYMMPPYCSTLNEISQGWSLVKEVLEELY